MSWSHNRVGLYIKNEDIKYTQYDPVCEKQLHITNHVIIKYYIYLHRSKGRGKYREMLTKIISERWEHQGDVCFLLYNFLSFHICLSEWMSVIK